MNHFISPRNPGEHRPKAFKAVAIGALTTLIALTGCSNDEKQTTPPATQEAVTPEEALDLEVQKFIKKAEEVSDLLATSGRNDVLVTKENNETHFSLQTIEGNYSALYYLRLYHDLPGSSETTGAVVYKSSQPLEQQPFQTPHTELKFSIHNPTGQGWRVIKKTTIDTDADCYGSEESVSLNPDFKLLTAEVFTEESQSALEFLNNLPDIHGLPVS